MNKTNSVNKINVLLEGQLKFSKGRGEKVRQIIVYLKNSLEYRLHPIGVSVEASIGGSRANIYTVSRSCKWEDVMFTCS